MIAKIILIIILVFLVLVIMYNVIGLLVDIYAGLKEKNEDKAFKAEKMIYEFLFSFVRTGRDFTSKSQVANPKVGAKKMIAHAILEFAAKFFPDLDPAKTVRASLTKDLQEAIVVMEKAKLNAEQHQSQEALNYIIDCHKELENIFNNMDKISSIAVTRQKIKEIREQMQIIADAPTFDDTNPSDPSSNRKTTANTKDYYQELGVARNASEDEIKKAFRELAQKYHPDKYSGLADDLRAQAEERFKDINEAYQVLIDPDKRAKYDATLS